MRLPIGFAGVREGLSPGVHELQDVEAAARIGEMDEDRLSGDIKTRGGVKGVGVGTDYLPGIGARKLRDVSEAVERHFAAGCFYQTRGQA